MAQAESLGEGDTLPLNALNVYNRKDVPFHFYEYDIGPVATGLSMFPFLPTFGLEGPL